MNLMTPTVIGWPSRVTVPLVGIFLIPHPATPTRAASRAQPTHTRALANRRSMSVTYQKKDEGSRMKAESDSSFILSPSSFCRMGPAARPGKRLPVAGQCVPVVRDTGVLPGDAVDAG